MKSLDKNDKQVEKTMQKKISKEDSNRYVESKKPVACTSSDGFKDERTIRSVSSSLGMTPNIEKTYLDVAERKLEKTKQENSSEKEPDEHEEFEKPMPCGSSDGFYAERLATSESSLTSGVNLNIGMTYLHNVDENVEYLEIVDDVMVKKEKSSDEGQQKSGTKKPMPDKFNAGQSTAAENSSALGVTTNIESIEMEYLHKKDEEKVEKYRYMTLDEDSKRREDIGRYKSLSVPCMSSAWANTRESCSTSGKSPASENLLNTEDEYDEVMTENESSVGYERPPVPPSCGYEEPDVVNSERPPVTGRNRSQQVTSTTGDTSVYQELQ